MGLDMYLVKYDIEKDTIDKTWEQGTEVGYWRKANAIHNWFVKNVQNDVDDCDFHVVSEENLIKLREVIMKVFDNKKNASKLLPTTSGFFFGGTEYDEYYYQTLEETILILNEVLDKTNFEKERIFYCSSW